MLADQALSDEKADQLGFKPFADAIAGIIDSPSTSTPMVLAINAKWGAGKTTLGLMIRRRLQVKPAAGGHAPHSTCWFNSWMHDDAPSLATSLASEIAQQSNRFRPLWLRFIRPLPLTFCKPGWRRFRQITVYGGVIVVVLFIAALVSSWLGVSLFEIFKLNPQALPNLMSRPDVASITALALASLLLLKIAGSFFPVAESVEKFVNDPQGAAKTASMPGVRRQLGRLLKQATPKKSKFVVFVDDLDRCIPPRPVDLLEAINQLLDLPNIVVVILADMSVIAKCVNIKYKDLAEQENLNKSSKSAPNSQGYGWSYLQKIVQLQFDLPNYQPAIIHKMLKTLAVTVPENLQRRRSRRVLRALNSFYDLVASGLPGGVPFITVGSVLALTGIIVSFFLSRRPSIIFEPPLSSWVTQSILIATIVSFAATLVPMGIRRISSILRQSRLRKSMDTQIRAKIAEGESDFSSVEVSIRRSHPSWTSTPEGEGLLRERLQQYLENESELQREAEDEIMRNVEPVPRHAKRLLNRLRLLLFVAHERKIFGGTPALTPRHIGKWAVLCERWPNPAQAIQNNPSIMKSVEDVKRYGTIIKQELEAQKNDHDFKRFCLSKEGIRLYPIIRRLVEFSPSKSSSTIPKEPTKS
ncbi:MAG TPA: P-loop NTPase fold protein [Candidatus Acidoferrales bacterium]|jgi:hypothetical protein|nr:P-loop NTPase fold protein [Candidatus Acidoferrales bacterium]